MKTIVVDDDVLALEEFERESARIQDIELIGMFQSPAAALAFARGNAVDFALLDIDMPGMNGLEMVDALRRIRPEMILIFITAHTGYTVQAIKKKADYIVFKPYNHEDLADAAARAKALMPRLGKRVTCKTFGRFNLFVDQQVVHFRSSKAKEILAFCIYREGGYVSSEELIDKLWENYIGTVAACSTFRTAVKELRDTLKAYHADQIFGRERGMCYIRPELIDCDYYRFLKNDPQAICDYQGEFMMDYSWGELALYAFNEKKALYLRSGGC